MKDGLLDKKVLEEFSRILTGKLTHEGFLQTMESAVVLDMTTAEYKEVADDIKALASEDNGALKEKIEKVATAMNIGLDFSAEEMIIVLGKLGALKDHDYSKPIQQGLLALVCQILTVEYESRYKGQSLLDKDISMMRFFLANELRLKLAKLKAYPEFTKLPPEVLSLIRDVVFDEATGQMLETLRNSGLHELIYSIKGTLFQGKRWQDRNRLYQAACKYADEEWIKGSQMTRNRMADYLHGDKSLHEKYQFGDLNYDKLRKRLGPIAAKHGKLPRRGRPALKAK